jgi:hypothetical protein
LPDSIGCVQYSGSAKPRLALSELEARSVRKSRPQTLCEERRNDAQIYDQQKNYVFSFKIAAGACGEDF